MNAESKKWDATLYDDKHAFVWKHGESLIELLAPLPGEVILDLGCGTGHLTAQIAKIAPNVTGVDQSAAMIDKARAQYPTLHFAVADARALTGVDVYDAVFSNAVLHWIPEADDVVRGIFRALKRGGRFAAEFGGKGNVAQILAAIQSSLESLGFGPVEPPWYYPSIAEYTGILERHGLEPAQAFLFDRPTELEGPDGLRNWISMFGGKFLDAVGADRKEEFLSLIEERLRPTLFRKGVWFADYRRLRVVARKP